MPRKIRNWLYLEEKQSTRQDYKQREIASKEGTPEGIETRKKSDGRLINSNHG